MAARLDDLRRMEQVLKLMDDPRGVALALQTEQKQAKASLEMSHKETKHSYNNRQFFQTPSFTPPKSAVMKQSFSNSKRKI